MAAGFRGQDAVDYARILVWQAIAYVRMERNAEQVAYVGKVVDAETGKVIRHVPAEQASGGDFRSETSGYDPSLQYERMAEVFGLIDLDRGIRVLGACGVGCGVRWFAW